jgi:hypothetical protein
MDVTTIAGIAGREARLGRDGLVAGPVDALAERGAGAVRAFADLDMTVVLVGSRVWDPAWSRHVPLLLDAPSPTVRARSAVWRAVLNGSAPIDIDPALATEQYRLTPDQIARAADAARLSALAAGRRVGENDIRAGARAQNAAALERLARRIVPVAQWDSLVLPSYVLRQLRELVARAKQREMVLDTWGMGRGSVRGRGITALFAGDSGTGKTLAAEVVAADLGLDVYSIDLATVVDKYIGETEKNLDRIFGDAERINGVLLFDEADALFGRRSGVRDARDRYANVEVAYLLQRMEMFEGIAILATNLRANMDEAFGRRLDVVVDFPFPEEDARLRLWEKHLSPDVPRLPDVDLAFLARAFRLAGGNIRNITLAGAFFAAAEARPLGMEDLIRGTEREYRKLGRLCLEGEFGPYFEVLNGPDPARAGKSDACAGC